MILLNLASAYPAHLCTTKLATTLPTLSQSWVIAALPQSAAFLHRRILPSAAAVADADAVEVEVEEEEV